jgi:hypothetical protein
VNLLAIGFRDEPAYITLEKHSPASFPEGKPGEEKTHMIATFRRRREGKVEDVVVRR